MLNRILLAATFALLLLGPAQAGSSCCGIDRYRTYIVESRHMMHMVLIATSVDWNATKQSARPALRAKLFGEVRRKNCLVLKSTNREFGYIKHKNGFVEIELRDKRDRLIGTTRVKWTSC